MKQLLLSFALIAAICAAQDVGTFFENGARVVGSTTSGNVPEFDANGNLVDSGTTPSAGGDVVGPASSTDHTLVRFDGATGKLIQGTGLVVDDADHLLDTLQIDVATATDEALILKSTDDDATEPLLEVLDSSDNTRVHVDYTGKITLTLPNTFDAQALEAGNIGVTKGGKLHLGKFEVFGTGAIMNVSLNTYVTAGGLSALDDPTLPGWQMTFDNRAVTDLIYFARWDGATQTFPLSLHKTGNVTVGSGTAADTKLDVYGAITSREKSADPANPDEGSFALWMSDGTGSGDDGDIMVKIKAGGVTKTITLVDFSAH
jgi:hypothetical protein